MSDAETPTLAVGPDVAESINCGDTGLARIGNRSFFPDVTPEIDAAVRDVEEECYVSSRGGNDRKIHLVSDDESGPLCEQGNSLLQKPLTAYPPGYFDLCATCVTMWRYREHGVRDELGVPDLRTAEEEPEVVTDGGQSTDGTDRPRHEPREAHCQCCGGYAGHGRDPRYCGTCRAAGEHLVTCPMCEDRGPRRSFDEVCSDCEETIDELNRLVQPDTQQEADR